MKIPFIGLFAGLIIRSAQRRPYFHLKDEDGGIYMERWWLKRPAGHGEQNDTSEVNKTGYGIRVHHTMRSDRERDLHDHPWFNVSIVLRGGYFEVMPEDPTQHPSLDSCFYKRVWRGPGSVVFRRATDRHRLELPYGETSWSLFIMGPWERDWGFWTGFGWVYWRTYLAQQAKRRAAPFGANPTFARHAKRD